MYKQNVLILCVLLLYLISGGNCFSKCRERRTEYGIVCVCDRNHCDTTPETPKLKKGFVHHISTAKDLPGFNSDQVHFTPTNKPLTNATFLRLNRKKRFQKLKGFGGSFTDAFGINVLSLSKKNQDNLLRSYFGKEGLRYNLCRVPIGATDFSTRFYYYDDVENDVRLQHFNLTQEDFSLKIPLIKKAMKMGAKKVNLIASNWSPPHWMKYGADAPVSYLKEEFFQLFADYQIKFLEEYLKENLTFWGITPVNEPLTGFWIHFAMENIIMTPEIQRKWIGHYFGPSLADKGFGDIKIMALDDERNFAYWYLDTMMQDNKAAKYLSGVALHWYSDAYSPPSVLDKIHRKYPGKFILYTESSVNKAFAVGGVINLGSWMRGALYAHNIIENLNHWSLGWVDWNMALNMEGGPNYVNGNCEAPILVDKEKDEFYKQPLYYAVGHFSAFTSEGSIRLDLSVENFEEFTAFKYVPPWPIPYGGGGTGEPVPVSVPEKIHSTATKNNDGSTTLFILNGKKDDVNVTIVDAQHGYLHVTLRAESMNSFVYW